AGSRFMVDPPTVGEGYASAGFGMSHPEGSTCPFMPRLEGFAGLVEWCMVDRLPLDADLVARTPPEVLRLLAQLLARVEKLEAENRDLKARLRFTTRRAGQVPAQRSPGGRLRAVLPVLQRGHRLRGTRGQGG